MPMRAYRFRELKPAGVPFTRKHITTLEKRGEFPQHFNLTDHSVAWVADEVDGWIQQRVRARRIVPLNSGRDTPSDALPHAAAPPDA